MARQRRDQKMQKGMFGSRPDPTDARNYARQNAMVDEAEAMIQKLPKPLQNSPATREAVDAAITAKYLTTDPRAQLAAAGLGVAGLGAAGLNAYAQLREEYLPSGPLDVAGRTIGNLIPGGGASTVGADPLAQARNNVASAAELVGSEAMLDALATDQINEMRGIRDAAMTPMEYEQLNSVQQMIDRRAAELMQRPIQKSDGSVSPMGFDVAQRIATEQVAMEMRAGQVY